MSDNKGSLFTRLTRLFRSGPIVRRRVKDFSQPAASSALEVFRKAHSDVYNSTLSAYGSFDRMSRYSDFSEMEACVSGDTLIATPDGYEKIRDLAEKYSPNESFVVYSFDHEKQQIVPALGKQARHTITDMSCKVTFDSGKELIATPDHRVMRRDGTYCEVQDLKPGDSMMPFYRRDLFAKKNKETTDGYRWIYAMDHEGSTLGNGWIAEHRLIAEWSAGRKVKKDEVVHHRNFVKHDNRPENLQIMTAASHRNYHTKIINGKKWDLETNEEWIKEFRKKHSRFMKENNPAQRHDITFAKILQLCDRDGFNLYQLSRKFDCDIKVIYRRLQDNGFDSFERFAKAYDKNWKNNGWDNRGDKNPRYDSSLTFQMICDEFRSGMTANHLANLLNTSEVKIANRLKSNGFSGWTDFKTNFNNHKVVSIEPHEVIDLYDLTVDGYKNYATDSIVIHNTPEIGSALDIYAEETCSSDDKGKVLHIYSENNRIQEILEELFYDVLNVDFNLTMWIRNLVKYGDFFIFNDISPEFGVINAYPIAINEIEREEGFDADDPMAVRFRWITQGNQVLENWQVSHFRLLGNDAFLPYGSSVLESARRIWRQLILMEDAMLVYRVIRAPERRVFYIDVGNIPPDEVANYMEQATTSLKRQPAIDKTTGKVDYRFNPYSVDEDYFLPVRGSEGGTKIDTLAGGQNAAAIEDVEYIQKKLFAALKIPRAYLGYDEDVGAKATLAQEDIRFSRTIARIQKTIVAELNKLAMIHLYCHGFDEEELTDFDLKLTNPSSIAQQQKLELIRTQFEIAGAVPEGIVDRTWIRRNVLNLTPDAIETIKEGRKADMKEDAEIEASGDEEGEETGGGDDLGGEEDLFAGDKPAGDLLTARPGSGNPVMIGDEEDEDLLDQLSMDDEDAPDKAEKRLKNAFGGPIKADRTIRHGPEGSNMPDLAKMVSVGKSGRSQDSMNKPFDEDFLFDTFSESEHRGQANRPRVTNSLGRMFASMGNAISSNKKTLLSESDALLNENETSGDDQ